jgi:hypothetical protein
LHVELLSDYRGHKVLVEAVRVLIDAVKILVESMREQVEVVRVIIEALYCPIQKDFPEGFTL